MQRRYKDVELISVKEMRRYIAAAKSSGMSPDSSCQHFLRGWMKFVAPFTPSSVDGVSSRIQSLHEGVEQAEHVPESVFVLLWEATAVISCFISLSGETALLLSEAWPTIWIWIKYIYHANLRVLPSMNAAQKVAFSERYQVIVATLGIFAKHGHNPIFFESIVNHESEILAMMADMWKEEGTDKNIATQGFKCCIFPANAVELIRHRQKFIAQVIETCGTAQEAVHVACQRVERHLEQKQRNYQVISTDLNFFISEIAQKTPSPLVQPIYTSPGVAIMLMHSWNHVASISFTGSDEHRSSLLTTCVGGAVMLAQIYPQAPNRISDMLHQDLLHLLAKSISLVQKSSPHHHLFRKGILLMLREILSPATVHREILSLIRQCVAAAMKRGDLRPLGTYSTVRDAWSGLQKLLIQREMVYSRFKKSPRTVILCGSRKCNNTISGTLRRCSACMILLYCSPKCQKEHWPGHKALCNSMRSTFEVCVDLSYPNLNFLSYLVIFDLVAHHGMMIASLSPAFNKRKRLFLFLNYVTVGQSTSSIELVDLNERPSFLPFSADDTFFGEWCQSFHALGEAMPFLVAIPQGAAGAVQVMTATVHIMDYSSSASPTGDPTESLKIRWLHCKSIHAPELWYNSK